MRRGGSSPPAAAAPSSSASGRGESSGSAFLPLGGIDGGGFRPPGENEGGKSRPLGGKEGGGFRPRRGNEGGGHGGGVGMRPYFGGEAGEAAVSALIPFPWGFSGAGRKGLNPRFAGGGLELNPFKY